MKNPIDKKQKFKNFFSKKSKNLKIKKNNMIKIKN